MMPYAATATFRSWVVEEGSGWAADASVRAHPTCVFWFWPGNSGSNSEEEDGKVLHGVKMMLMDILQKWCIGCRMILEENEYTQMQLC